MWVSNMSCMGSYGLIGLLKATLDKTGRPLLTLCISASMIMVYHCTVENDAPVCKANS